MVNTIYNPNLASYIAFILLNAGFLMYEIVDTLSLNASHVLDPYNSFDFARVLLNLA